MGLDFLLTACRCKRCQCWSAMPLTFVLNFSLCPQFSNYKADDWTRWLTFEVCPTLHSPGLGLFIEKRKKEMVSDLETMQSNPYPLYLWPHPPLPHTSVWHLPLPLLLTLQRDPLWSPELSVNTLEPLSIMDMVSTELWFILSSSLVSWPLRLFKYLVSVSVTKRCFFLLGGGIS